MRRVLWTGWSGTGAAAALGLALVAGAAGAAAAGAPAESGGGDEAKVKRVVVREAADCQGGAADCAGEVRVVRRVFVDEEGGVHPLGAGEHEWVEERLVGGGRESGAYLGVVLQPLTAELRTHYGVPAGAGVLVGKVLDDSPAWRAGVRVGDVLTSIDGRAIASPVDAAAVLAERAAGESAVVELWRDGAAERLTASLDEWAGGPRRVKKIIVHCTDGDEDCAARAAGLDLLETGPGLGDYDCGGAAECRVEVSCQAAGDCTCTVNGEAADCSTIPGPHNG